MKKPANEKPNKTGPKPDTVIINGNWEDSIGKALEKKRPEAGWPDDKKKRPRK